jgi:hypothetical protein
MSALAAESFGGPIVAKMSCRHLTTPIGFLGANGGEVVERGQFEARDVAAFDQRINDDTRNK